MSSVPISLTGDRRRQRKEATIRGAFALAAASSVAISVLIVITLAGKAIEFLTNVGLGKLWSDGWYPRRDLYDVRTVFVGTIATTAIAMLVATPLGLGAAIYLSEYATARARALITPVLELLASIPSVVIGFFALTWINPNIVQVLNPAAENFNLAAAGLGIGVLVTPLIASVSQDALTAVPTTLREAAYGMGSKKLTTTVRVVLPAAVSGIVAALILGISRAIGETMVVAIASGGSGGSLFSTDVFAPGQTVTAAMASLASGSDQVKGAGQAFNSLFFLGMLLFLTTLVLNLAGNAFVRRVRNRY